MPDLNEIIRLGALAGTYQSGFAILFESVDERGIPDPRIQLACLDASLIMRPIFTKFHSGLGSLDHGLTPVTGIGYIATF